MKKTLILLAIILAMTTNAYAERWIQCVPVTIGSVSYDRPVKRDGDCQTLNLCTGNNNTGLLATVFEAQGSEWNDASGSNAKCDISASAGDRIIELTAQELSDIATTQTLNQDLVLRQESKGRFDGQTVDGQVLRCLSVILMKEINIARKWTLDLKSEVASTNSLNNFKTRVATLPNLNPRTLSQIKNAMKQCIDDKDVDE